METPIIDQLEYEMSEHGDPSQIIAKARELERENARLQMELDASCNAEELRQVRAENIRLREALRLAIHVRGTSEDTVEVLRVMEAAFLPNAKVRDAASDSRSLDTSRE